MPTPTRQVQEYQGLKGKIRGLEAGEEPDVELLPGLNKRKLAPPGDSAATKFKFKFIVCSNEHSIKIVFILRIQLQELQGDPSWITEPGERAGPLSIG